MMNKKNKVLLSTVGLLLLSGIAATSSTFAWFTTVRSATINYGSATVESKDANLQIAYVNSENTLTNSPAVDQDNVLEIAGTNAVTDISGDGENFFKPVWASQTDSATGVASSIGAVTTADGHYVDFKITVSRSNALAEPGLKVYLGTGTEFTAPNAHANLLKSVRLAVLDNLGAPMFRWAPEQETSPKYLIHDEDGEAYWDGTNPTDHTLQADSNLKYGTILTATTLAGAVSAGDYLVADLSTGTAVSATISFRAWIEGADVHATNDILDAAAKTFNLDVKLYGLVA